MWTPRNSLARSGAYAATALDDKVLDLQKTA